MADCSDIRCQAGEAAGHAQVKKDQIVDSASEACQESKEQAGGIVQQAGEQVRDMAQNAGEQARGMAQNASDAVKNAVGMGDNSSSN